MEKDWKKYAQEFGDTFGRLAKGNPEMAKTVMGMAEYDSKGALDAKTRELISLAVAVTTRCEGCIIAHTQAAVKAGATRQELQEALATAIAMNTGAAAVYSSRVLEAYDQLSQ